MKKSIIALLALSGLAMADYVWDGTQSYSYAWDFSQESTQNNKTGVLGGTVTNTFVTESVEGVGTAIKKGSENGKYWEVNTNTFLYDAITAATTTNAVLTLTLDYYWTGASWGENILHVGKDATGIAYGLSNGYLSMATGTAVDETFGASKTDLRLTANAWNTITFSLSNNEWTASLNGVTSTAKALGSITWDSAADERNKYAIGIKAPGWNSGATGLNDSGCKIANMTVSYVGYTTESPIVPEPATATLSLLALAGLAARRRRK